MTSLTSHTDPIRKYLRRTLRAWWADGLWDLAMAGFLALTALWLYPLIRALAFPSWTWPWPFITQEPVNPMQHEIALWGLGTLAIWGGFVFLAYRVVSWLKRRLVAPRLGDVRFKFILPIENRVTVIFAVSYLLGSLLVIGLLWLTKGGPQFATAFCAVAPAGLLFAVGKIYNLPRYQWVSFVGLGLSLLVEFFTTAADYMHGPVNFWDVSPIYGNPSLTLLVWAGVLLISGVLALYQTLRLPRVSD